MARKTDKEYRAEVFALCGKNVLVKETYINYNTAILHKCGVCKHEWKVTPNNILFGQGCPECGKLKRIKTKTKRTEHTYPSELKLAHNGNIVLLEKFASKTKLLHRCLLCTYEWLASPYRLCKGHSCPSCKGKGSEAPKKEHVARLKAKHGTHIKLVEYCWPPRRSQKSKYVCSKGHEFETYPAIIEACNCPVCAFETKGFTSNYKSVKIDGKTFKLQGYEKHALLWLLDNTRLTVKDISEYSSGKVPHITWTEKGRTKFHLPDLYVSKSNTLYEVKSTATIGLDTFIRLTPCEIFNSVKKKATLAIAKGFKYEILLMTGKGERIKLPKNWRQMTFREFRKEMITKI